MDPSGMTVVDTAPPLRSVSHIVILQTDMGAAGRGTLTVTLQAANTVVAAGVGAGPWSIAQKDSGCLRVTAATPIGRVVGCACHGTNTSQLVSG